MLADFATGWNQQSQVLANLEYDGYNQFGRDIFRRDIDQSVLQEVWDKQTELMAKNALTNDERKEIQEKRYKDVNWKVAEYRSYYTMVASFVRNPDKELYLRMLRHSYRRQFYSAKKEAEEIKFYEDAFVDTPAVRLSTTGINS